MKVIIVGGVAIGPKVAARLRRINQDAEITILERGNLISYGGCGLPLYLGMLQGKGFHQVTYLEGGLSVSNANFSQ